MGFDDRDSPIVVAPMAGGISTPALIAATAAAGAFGFLAAGYQRVDQLNAADGIAGNDTITGGPGNDFCTFDAGLPSDKVIC